MERTINKMTYRKSNGEKEVYSYYITITKKEIKEVGLDPTKKAKIKLEGNKIVISQ